MSLEPRGSGSGVPGLCGPRPGRGKKPVRMTVLLLGCVLFITACWLYWAETDPRISLEDGSAEAALYRNSSVVRTEKLRPGAAGTNAIRTLLEKKRGRWRLSLPISYAPDELRFYSKDFVLDIRRDMIILNCESRLGHFVELVTPMSTEEYGRIRKAVLDGVFPGDAGGE